MLGKQIRADPFHVEFIRTPLTRNLGYRFPEITDEILEAFGEIIPPTGGTHYAYLIKVIQQNMIH